MKLEMFFAMRIMNLMPSKETKKLQISSTKRELISTLTKTKSSFKKMKLQKQTENHTPFTRLILNNGF